MAVAWRGCVLLLALVVACVVAGRIPVNVMLPLDVVTAQGVTDVSQLQRDLAKLKQGGVDGVMGDVWWGLVEQQPQQYNWTAYAQLASLVRDAGLSWQAVMSFHKCGGNVGDTCNVSIPVWALTACAAEDAFYRDSSDMAPDEEYISLGADDLTLLPSATANVNRTPIDAYGDFMSSFRRQFADYISSGALTEVQVGMGPAGELRYPGYQLGKWAYCGVGEFQCYDKHLRQDLLQAAVLVGHPHWGVPPMLVGNYNSSVNDTTFFSKEFATPHGRFFAAWYAQKLLDHGRKVLAAATSAFAGTCVDICGKVSGIHWWYADPSHAAEMTTGYDNANGNNAYLQLANMFSEFNVTFDFTCLEMVDPPSNDPDLCKSRPEELVRQTIHATQAAGILYEGENALEQCGQDCNKAGFDEIIKESTQYGDIDGFTYLRLSRALLDNQANWATFTNFVQQMHNH
eukprot:TRINITY_DN18502_c0_g1_i1.p1 TRINITY_DN18502_c0_g1~~TRINITY_DN18502_c0_g1_i1.p1  ORF type:complete len:464 (-),score=105.22 TRINITY_DN18502_c0_g1_i1:743-2113(-)